MIAILYEVSTREFSWLVDNLLNSTFSSDSSRNIFPQGMHGDMALVYGVCLGMWCAYLDIGQWRTIL